MAWTAPRTWIVGEIVTAAQLNTHLRDNMNATAVAMSTSAGDMTYATGANALTRLPIGSAGALLRSTGTQPVWVTSINVDGATSAVGIGATAMVSTGLIVNTSDLSGTTQFGIQVLPAFTSSATNSGIALNVQLRTAAVSFTMANGYGAYVHTGSKGAGSTITTTYGVFIQAQTSGSTNNYGLYVEAPSGGSSNNEAIRLDGTLNFSGDVRLIRSAVNQLTLDNGDTFVLGSDSTSALRFGITANLYMGYEDASTLAISGNTQNIHLDSGGTATVRVDCSANNQARVSFEEDGVFRYRVGYNGTANLFFINSTDTNGAGADADVIQILDGQLTVDGNSTFDANAFDWVCATCGRHAEKRFRCCGPVSWHDDVELMTRAVLPWRDNPAIDQMEKLGLMRRHEDQLFISMNRIPFFLMSGMGQMYGRMQIMAERIQVLEAQLGRRG